MSNRRFWFGIVAGAGAFILLTGLLTGSGVLSMAATAGPSPIDRLGHVMWESSMFWRAPDAKNPFADDTSAVSHGFEHFRAMCVHCHGAPNVKRAEWAQGMLPLPPDLTAALVQARSDGKLFYIISHGVRATGMPAFAGDHGDDEVWHLVAFLRKLPGLTEEQERTLKDAVGHFEHPAEGRKSPAEHNHPG